MSLRLASRGVPTAALQRTVIGRICEGGCEPWRRPDHLLLVDELPASGDWRGYAGLLVRSGLPAELVAELDQAVMPAVHGAQGLHYLEQGDIVALMPGGRMRALYRISSPHNSLLLTERCNSFCVMCSQPPRKADDRGLIAEHLRVIDLMDPGTAELGITGGEPTLLKDDLVLLVERCKALLPATALHILSNGRMFYYGAFARRLGAVGHLDLMIGVPLYADVDHLHDFVVQAEGAFGQTLIGLHNLARYGVAVEIRVVLHRFTWQRLARIAEFIYRNLPFAAHVAFMGLEPMGFAVPNLQELWIDPREYGRELGQAVGFLAHRGLRVSIYNHQLCTLPEELWPYSRKSISDWKNEYLPACEGCAVRAECGGFFTSTLRRLDAGHIRPITARFPG